MSNRINICTVSFRIHPIIYESHLRTVSHKHLYIFLGFMHKYWVFPIPTTDALIKLRIRTSCSQAETGDGGGGKQRITLSTFQASFLLCFGATTHHKTHIACKNFKQFISILSTLLNRKFSNKIYNSIFMCIYMYLYILVYNIYLVPLRKSCICILETSGFKKERAHVSLTMSHTGNDYVDEMKSLRIWCAQNLQSLPFIMS